MNELLREALEYCHRQAFRAITLVVPAGLDQDDLEELLAIPSLIRIHAWGMAEAFGGRLRPLAGGPLSLALHDAPGTIVLVAPDQVVSPGLLLRQLLRGRNGVHCLTAKGFRRISLVDAGLDMAADVLLHWAASRPPTHLLRRTTEALRAHPAIRKGWLRIFRRRGNGSAHPIGGAASREVDRRFDMAFRRLLAMTPLSSVQAETGRVVVISDGLGPGGAERQIVATIRGLMAAGLRDVTFLGHHLHDQPDLAFFLPDLLAVGAGVASVQRRSSVFGSDWGRLPPPMACAMAELPAALARRIVETIDEIRRRRPAVVHTWMDLPNVIAGLAAVLCGVPRVVLSLRSMNPTHFSYWQPFMAPAYRALAAIESVCMVCNSRAGAASYAHWLGIPADRIAVIYNGLDTAGLQPASQAKKQAERKRFGLPSSGPVVGTLLRFSDEKRPFLWLAMAKKVAEALPGSTFLVGGDGQLRDAFRSEVKRCGLDGRVMAPGLLSPAAAAIAAMDLLVLTSSVEGLPNVVLEAQALGVPVVATAAGGTAEAVGPFSGQVLTEGDADQLAAAVIDLLGNRNRLADMADAGPGFIAGSFSVRTMVEETLEAYGGVSKTLLGL